MASFKGFGRDSGPSAPPKSQPLFGQYFPRAPAPHNATSTTTPPPLASLSSTTPTFQRPPRDLDAPEEPFYSSYDWIHPGPGPTHTPKQNASSLSPPRLGGGNNTTKTSGGQPNLRLSTSVNDMIPGNAVSQGAPKRTRSPPSLSRQGFDGKSYAVEDDTERELQAKAKRLARFKTELSFENAANASMKSDQPKPVKPRLAGDDAMEDDVDNEQLQPMGAIIGLCPDMCPETEREERERKGDLDQYERINGDRNQSRQDVAVKKYTRTAEREPELIRPMPVLQKTMEYLLNLLDQPYDDRFLGLYNFLWDRMRAIRMDLRMQHIFNLEAISMLEQMIRLHIIAMHELCEYTKGEGFSEGFDAHLNIEQMNKTSVELFQMYDDHRKRGVDVPTEKEFRGYYALLKLDKHPGYKVEPAELSLDLAKMTPEIRKTAEVIFARDVARSCRVGNFIAFFRLARKATYLQACLMHAHFSKLRTQALASLHCGLQNNQGLPVALGAKWLGLEEEGAEDLLEYHGFSIKEYEEPYMVKEHPFLNSDKDYPTRCSELVHLKKSKTIVEDILHLNQETPQPSQDLEQPLKVVDIKSTPAKFVQTASSPIVTDEEMTEIKASSSPSSLEFLHKNKLAAVSHGWHDRTGGPISNGNVFQVEANDPFNKDYPHNVICRKEYQHNGEEYQLEEKGFQPWIVSSPKLVPDPLPVSSEWMPEQTAEFPAVISPRPWAVKSFQSDDQTQAAVTPSDNEFVRAEDTSSALVASVVASDVHHDMVIDDLRHEERDDAHQAGRKDLVITNQIDNEVAEAKLRLLLRLWRRLSQRKGEIRKQYKLAANAALNALSLGLPLKLSKARPGPYEVFNIDEIMSQRFDKFDHSWSTINVADLVGDELYEMNANSQCICWKIILYSQAKQEDDSRSLSYQSSVDCWLHSKIMPSSSSSYVDGLVTASPGLVIWRKWIIDSSVGSSCCLSVIKDLSFTDSFDNLAGARGIIFIVSDILSWEHQKMQLHNLVGSLPSGPATSLLILSGFNMEELSDQTSIFHRLGLSDLDRSRIRNVLVVNLYDIQNLKDNDGYYSDERLREGLKWLATESLPQPALCYVKTRELVLAHLNSSLESLNRKGFHEIDPNQCISAFNEALNKAIGNIVTAANAIPLGWPCPELSLLDNSTEEHRAVKWFLPCLGWNSQDKIQSLVSALGNCRLPDFLDDTSFLHRGSQTIDEFEEQRLHLRDCLISYLNQSSKLMNFTLSLKEASAMLQTGARLKLHGTAYYLVPNWVLIFRRVFNWQLSKLSGKSCSTAYVLEQHRPLSVEQTKAALVDNSSTIASGIYQPSLDEMVEVSFRRSPGVPKSLNTQPEDFQHVPVRCGKESKELKKTSFSLDGKDNCSQLQEVEGDDVSSMNSDNFKYPTTTISPGAREADKLSRLLDQCNMLQNKIAEKLSIYF